MKKILLSMLALLGMATANAQSWNFTTVSDSDLELLGSAGSGWTHDTASSNDRYNTDHALELAPLAAGATELDYARGLRFTAAAANARIDVKGKRMWLGGAAGETKLVIPGVAAGKQLTVIGKSSSSSAARAINVSANVTPTQGQFGTATTDQVTNVGVVSTAGSVELTFTGGMYIYEISIDDPDNDNEEAVDDTPATPTVNDFSTSANGMKNQVLLATLTDGVRYYNTDDVSSIDVSGNRVTVSQAAGSYTFDGNVSSINFKKATTGSAGTVTNAEGKVQITEARGWLESAYVKFSLFDGAAAYNVYVKGGRYADYTRIDEQLVRNYGTYGRADVPGLVAGGDYAIRVVPVGADKQELTAAANEAVAISVAAYDRSGFAHKGRTAGIGAYNNDGSLKENARVVYVTRGNAKTVSLDIATNSSGKTATYTGLQQIIYGYQKGDANGSYEKRPLDIRLVGCISAADCDEFLSSAEGIQIKGAKAYQEMNITIEGVGDDATVTGFGFLLRSSASIELRNFGIMLCMDDAVSIDTDNQNIWVHHLDLFYGKPGSDADQAKGDGTLDIKGDSKYVTFYANHLWDSGKTSLCGMKSETGPNWITYHHNWFDHSDSRHPRIRTMSVHVYNNYYDGNSKYGVGAAYQSNAFVERNYFRNCKYPMLISMQGSDVATNPKGTFSGEDGGIIKAYANKIVGATGYVTYQKNAKEFDAYEAATRDEQVPATVAAKQGGRKYDNFDTDASLFYTYMPDEADRVPELVTGWLGAGRMGHGDLQWQFDNAAEDRNYNVIEGLKSALQSYKSKLVGIFGDENAASGEQGSTGGTDQPGGDTDQPGGGTPITGATIYTFDGSPSNAMFTVGGSYGDGKITYNGTSYKKGVKLDSKGSITFTPSQNVNMTLVLATAKSGRDVKLQAGDAEAAKTTVGGTENAEGAYYQMEPIALTAGTKYVLTKGSAESIVMLVILAPAE